MKKKVIILLLVLLVIIGTSAGIFILYNQAVADKKEKTADPIKIETPEKPTEPEEELKKKKSLSNRRNRHRLRQRHLPQARRLRSKAGWNNWSIRNTMPEAASLYAQDEWMRMIWPL